MNRSYTTALLFALLPTGLAYSQAPQPPVSTIMKKYDSNSDGVLTAPEVAGSRYARQFSRWDADKDKSATSKEIIDFRAKFGINADGTLMRGRKSRQSSSPNLDEGKIAMLPIPDVDELARVSRSNPPSRETMQISAFVLATSKHPVTGDRYFVITDHTESEYLHPLERLAHHHHGTVIQVDDLARLHASDREFKRVREQLIGGNAKWVAIAPRLESFRENMLLGMWKLLASIDDDPQIDVFPGVLVATNESSFARLIQQSIDFSPRSLTEMRPFAISQVQRQSELRSLQKAAILRKLFEKKKLETPIVGIYGQLANNAPKLSGNKVWNLKVDGKKGFVKKFPEHVSEALSESNLIIMHGHGIPGMSCSVDNDGLPDSMVGKILLTGSCFSAAPVKSDLPGMRQAPGGYTVEKRDAFIVRAIDNGAVMAFGHQRLSSGFPHLFPVLEGLVEGKSAGAVYQQLLNALIELRSAGSEDFVVSTPPRTSRVPQNAFLYVLIGDPALQPFKKKP